MTTPAEVVHQFLAAWPGGEAGTLAAYFSDDAIYHNIPMDPIKGRDSIEAAFQGFLGMVDTIRFDTLHLLADGPIVVTERVDHFIGTDRTISLPVMGIFEVRDGLITAWRDYFDLNQFTSQMPGGG